MRILISGTLDELCDKLAQLIFEHGSDAMLLEAVMWKKL